MTVRRSDRALRACVVLLTSSVLVLVSACSPPAESSDEVAPSTVQPITQPKAQRLLDAGLDGLPRLRTRLPHSVPASADGFPSLLTDPPGRALLAYHPPETIGFHTPQGWASETVLFNGRDGRWRALRLDELGLPAQAWPGSDTYGAGSLSPDGRWWAGRSRVGVVLIDLSTGQHRLVETGADWISEIRWLSDSRAYLVSNGRTGPRRCNLRVTVPDLQVTELPYRLWQVGIAPDGTAYSLRRVRIGEAELVEHRGGELVPHGRLVLPGFGQGVPHLQGVTATKGRFAILRQRNVRRVALVVVDSASLEVDAKLVFNNLNYTVRAYDWLDPETMVLDTSDGIVAWRPDSAELFRVLDIPPAGADRYWSVELAGPNHAGVTITRDWTRPFG